jgi:hypothetical protein
LKEKKSVSDVKKNVKLREKSAIGVKNVELREKKNATSANKNVNIVK